MEILGSALKHGVRDADIQHAWLNAIRLVEYDYEGEDRLLVIGADRNGRLPELVRACGYTDPDHPRRPASTEVLLLPEMR